MYEEINRRLFQNQQYIYRSKKIEAMLDTLRKELHSLEEKAQSAKNSFEKESKDYKKIAKKSISSIFYSILGNLAEKTEKERQEALKAEITYNQCIQDLEEVKAQISKLEEENSQYKNVQVEYDNCFNEKFQMLMRENSGTAQDIMKLNEHIEQIKSNMREINEAIRAGHDVTQCLSIALKSLDSAENWGVWDLFGGGLISDMAKHSHIDDASNAARQAQSALRSFRTELADVNISEDFQIEISDFAKFADFFFDGLFADLFMQNKINTAQENVSSVQNQVQHVLHKLDDLKNAAQNEQDSLHAQLSMLVVDA